MPERSPRLEGKVAIVTGAGTSGPGVGNGRAAATLFAREGAKVLLSDLDEGRGQRDVGTHHRIRRAARPPRSRPT